MTSISLKPLRSAVAELLAMAALELFPDVILLDAEVNEIGFSYGFSFSSPLHPEILPMLEENMRRLIKEGVSFKMIEMMGKNAAAYFEHHHQPYKAEAALDSMNPTISLIQCGEFRDLYVVKPLLGELGALAFRLLDIKEMSLDGNLIHVISGTVFHQKDELKEFLKVQKKVLKDKPWLEGERRGLLLYSLENEPFLLPEGVAFQESLQRLWEKAINQRQLAIVSTGSRSIASARIAHRELADYLKKGVAEWGLSLSSGASDIGHLFCPPANLLSTCISSLQFILETVKMFELSVDWAFCTNKPNDVQARQWKQGVDTLANTLDSCGLKFIEDQDKSIEGSPRIEGRIRDSLGKEWSGPYLSVGVIQPDLKGNSNALDSIAFVEFSLFGPQRRLIALLAELKPEMLTKFKRG